MLRQLKALTRLALVLGMVLGLAAPGTVTAQAPATEEPRERIEALLPPSVRDAGITPPQPDPEPVAVDANRWSRIAVQSLRDRNWEIYVGRVEGLPQERVTASPAADVHPDLAPEGAQVVFASNRGGNFDLYVANPDGSGLRQLTSSPQDDVYPAWSPDGSRIAFTSYRDGQPEIYVIGVDGRGEQRLTFNADPVNGNAFDSQPAWSPDGQRLAFTSKRSGGYRIWIMNANGSAAVALPTPPYSQNPAWSPDGQRLVLDADSDDNGFQELFVINTNGSALTPLQASGSTEALAGEVSPDGARYSFTTLTYEVFDGQLYITAMDIAYRLFSQQTPGPGSGNRSGTFDTGVVWRSLDTRPPVTRLSAPAPITRAAGTPVSVSAYDPGVSGLERVEVETRIGQNGPWLPWVTVLDLSRPDQIELTYQGVPGQTVSFRSRGIDGAGNIEPWRPMPDATVALFTWEQLGLMVDNRNMPIANLGFSLSPAALETPQSGVDGRYLLHLTGSGVHQLTIPAGPYAGLSERRALFDGDRPLVVPLGPADNIVRNGSFESPTPFEHWTVSGPLTATVESAYASSGQSAAVLGRACRVLRPCYTIARYEPGTGWPPPSVEQIGFSASDTLGRLHQIVFDSPALAYRYRLVDARGTVVSQEALPFAANGVADLAVSGDGRVHLVYWSNYGESLLYRQRSSTSWSDAESIPVATVFSNSWITGVLTVDRAGQVHVLAFHNDLSDNLSYSARNSGGSWSDPVILDQGNRASLISEPSGQIHAVWVRWDGVVWSYRTPAGTWSAPALIIADPGTGDRFGTPQMLAGQAGQVTILVTLPNRSDSVTHTTAVATYEPVFDRWFVEYLDQAVSTAWVEASGQVGAMGDVLRHRLSDRVWTDPWLLQSPLQASVDAFDRVRLIGNREANGRVEYTTRLSPITGTASLSQTVSIPAGMHAPTLAFTYRLTGANPIRQSGLVVRVGGSPVFTDTLGSPIRQVWVDLAPWAGQTVSLSFTLTRQDAEDANTELYLDDVSVGSWLTPVVTAVSPAQIADLNAAHTLTITGTNFIGQPEVRVGTQALLNVRRLSETTLIGEMPPGMTPGLVDVVVINPGGQRGGSAAAVDLGRRIFLPALGR